MHLPDPRAVKRVGIIGAGTIGASWAAHFLARGMDVQFWDPGSRKCVPGSPVRGRRLAGSGEAGAGARGGSGASSLL